MNDTQQRRLRKLIKFLRDKKAFSRKTRRIFRFSLLHARVSESPACQSVGCAIGWLHVVLPSLVRVAHVPVLKAGKSFSSQDPTWKVRPNAKSGWQFTLNYARVASVIFGMPEQVARFLFAPVTQNLVHGSLRQLPASATPREVADVLEHYLKLKTGKEYDHEYC